MTGNSNMYYYNPSILDLGKMRSDAKFRSSLDPRGVRQAVTVTIHHHKFGEECADHEHEHFPAQKAERTHPHVPVATETVRHSSKPITIGGEGHL